MSIQTHIHILERRPSQSSVSDFARGLSPATGTICDTSSVWRVDQDLEINEVQTADVVVVRQRWPDEYSTADVQRLLLTAALAEIVVAYGPWCDADGRNRDIWPTGCRIPEVLLAKRLRSIIAAKSESPPFVAGSRMQRLPRTASRNELIEFDYLSFADLNRANANIPAMNADQSQLASDTPSDDDDEAPIGGLRVGICSSDIAYRDYLSALVREIGGTAVSMKFDGQSGDDVLFLPVDCVLVDLDAVNHFAVTGDDHIALHQREQQLSHLPKAGRIALTSRTCPRYAESVLQNSGFAACLWKLAPASELVAVLRQSLTAR